MASRGIASAVRLGAAVLLAASVASAQEPVGDPPAAAPAATPASADELDALVKQAGAPDVASRIAASERLLSGPFRLKDIEEALRRGDLSPEQRLRLITVARRRFDNEPRGAMGIEFNMDAPDVRGALIRNAKREFPAGEVLRPHDRIIQADGVVIERRDALRRIIVAHDPGDEVPLVVERDGATIAVTVKLGEFGLLGQPRDKTVQDQAWERRSRDYHGAQVTDDRPVECGIQGAAWAQGPELDDDSELMGVLPSQRIRVLPGGEERTGVVAGGEARLGLAKPEAAVPSLTDQMLRGPRPAGMANPALATLYARRSGINDDLARLRSRAASPQTSQQQRQAIQILIDRKTLELKQVEVDIQRINPPRGGGR